MSGKGNCGRRCYRSQFLTPVTVPGLCCTGSGPPLWGRPAFLLGLHLPSLGWQRGASWDQCRLTSGEAVQRALKGPGPAGATVPLPPSLTCAEKSVEQSQMPDKDTETPEGPQSRRWQSQDLVPAHSMLPLWVTRVDLACGTEGQWPLEPEGKTPL